MLPDNAKQISNNLYCLRRPYDTQGVSVLKILTYSTSLSYLSPSIINKGHVADNTGPC